MINLLCFVGFKKKCAKMQQVDVVLLRLFFNVGKWNVVALSSGFEIADVH